MTGTSYNQAGAGYYTSQAGHIREFNDLYSSNIRSDDANGMLLSQAVRVRANADAFPDPWSEDHDDDPGNSALLRLKTEQLEEARKKFLKYLSEGQKKSISNSANTTQAVLNIVDSASFDWLKRSESGSTIVTGIKRKFFQVCKSLDQHKDLFSMLPKDSEYVSVFYGAFNSIVAASVMHQAMATGLPKIVDELNAIINDVAIKLKLYPESQMKRVVMELYTRIFDLLARLMKWYTKNHHLWKLMKKDCYADFEMALRDIRNWAQMVNNGAWNNFVLESRRANTEARGAKEVERIAQERYVEDRLQIAMDYYEMKENKATQQAIQQAQRELLSPEAHVNVLADALLNRIFQRVDDAGAGQAYILASSASSMAVNTVESSMTTSLLRIMDSRPSSAKDVVTLDSTSTKSMNYDPSSPAQNIDIGASRARLQTKEEVEHLSRRFDEWYPEGRLLPVQYIQAPASRPTLHESIASRLLQWMKATESKVLCIQLPYDPTPGSVGSQIAAHVVSSAYDVDYPILSYFCTLPRSVADGRSAQTTALCEMLACLIRQLVMALPEKLPETSAVVLTAAIFDSIVGTLKTWESMLNLFADLLSLIPTGILIVIHGMQCLDSEHTTSPIQDLLAVLRKRLDSKDDTAGHTAKILFVMEGQSRGVVPWLRRWEYVLYDGDQRLSR